MATVTHAMVYALLLQGVVKLLYVQCKVESYLKWNYLLRATNSYRVVVVVTVVLVVCIVITSVNRLTNLGSLGCQTL